MSHSVHSETHFKRQLKVKSNSIETISKISIGILRPFQQGLTLFSCLLTSPNYAVGSNLISHAVYIMRREGRDHNRSDCSPLSHFQSCS